MSALRDSSCFIVVSCRLVFHFESGKVTSFSSSAKKCVLHQRLVEERNQHARSHGLFLPRPWGGEKTLGARMSLTTLYQSKLGAIRELDGQENVSTHNVSCRISGLVLLSFLAMLVGRLVGL